MRRRWSSITIVLEDQAALVVCFLRHDESVSVIRQNEIGAIQCGEIENKFTGAIVHVPVTNDQVIAQGRLNHSVVGQYGDLTSPFKFFRHFAFQTSRKHHQHAVVAVQSIGHLLCSVQRAVARGTSAFSSTILLQTRTVVASGVGIKVAGSFVNATEQSRTTAIATFVQLQARIVVACSVDIKVAGSFVSATGSGARTVVASGVGIKVAGVFVSATEQSCTTALAALVRVEARFIVARSGRIKVAGVFVCAT